MPRNYDDIIHLPHHVSAARPRMSMEERAAQFSPFAALTGFGAVITETGRPTEKRIELDEYEKALLNDKLNALRQQLDDHPQVQITYFRPDEQKTGGAYVSAAGAVKKIDDLQKTVLLTDTPPIPIADIIAINAPAPEAGPGMMATLHH